MARKSADKMAMRYVEPPFYNDWPGCVTTYKWLVEAGLKNVMAMFNEPVGSQSHATVYCKVCGGKVKNMRSWMSSHVQEHARQLGLIVVPEDGAVYEIAAKGGEEHVSMSAGPDDDWPLFDDITSTITDAIEGRSEPEDGVLGFNEYVPELSRLLASAIVAASEERDDVGNAVFCPDCES